MSYERTSSFLPGRAPTAVGSTSALRIVSLLFFCIAGFAPNASSQLLSSSQVVDWTPGVAVGVPGGIPTRTKLIDVTVAPYNADRTGATSASAAIQAAINAAKPQDVVYLPAGRYLLTTPLIIGPAQDNITLRGAGMDKTILDARGGSKAIYLGSSSDYRWNSPSAGNTVTNGLHKGSTVLTVGNTSEFSVGQILHLAIANETNEAAIQAGATPTISVFGYRNQRRQKTRLMAKTATTLTIYPALYGDFRGYESKIYRASVQTDGSGIESLTVDCSNAPVTFGIHFEQAFGCWIYDVKVTKSDNYAFYITDSLNCEIRRSYADQRKTQGTNGAGILFGGSSACLIEDNILYRFFPLIEVNSAACGNVFAYNFCHDSSVNGSIGMSINTNHNPHNFANLYEGNSSTNMQSDGYFGGASDDVVFRNWLHGTSPDTTKRAVPVILNRFTRNYAIVGNILGSSGATTLGYSFGNPNMGNGMFNGRAAPAKGTFWKDWNATASLSGRNSDTSGSMKLNSGSLYAGQLVRIYWDNAAKVAQFQVASVSGTTITFSGANGDPLPAVNTVLNVFMGPPGFQEIDEDVESTTYRKGNYSYGAAGFPSGETIDPATLPSSLFRSTKPAFFGDRPWPAFDPFRLNPEFTHIPAGYRYFNGNTDPSPSPQSSPSNVRINIQGE